MADLPTGTVTMLFSDIEGSTVLLSRLGDRYADALDAQRSALRAAWASWGGREMGTEGDSFFVVFDVARNAVRAALDAHRALLAHTWPGGESVRVRIGVHTGEPAIHNGGYIGMDVHRAARVAGAAHGGQLVLTDATAHLVRDNLPRDASVVDLGWHRMKDLPAPEHLFQLTADGLPDSFPPLRTLGTASSLPTQSMPLVGRDADLGTLTELIAHGGGRLVTLTGPGGAGKTSLAVGLARGLVESFPDGVYFVSLAGITSRDGMWSTIADALSTSGESRTQSRVLEQLAHRRALLVLDNLEQLREADSVVAELLAATPAVSVVATSRGALHLRGEREHFVPPLALPDRDSVASAELSSAVQLFCQHARLVRSSFELTDDNVRAVSAICRRLDGLPLAIELVAARSRLLSPQAMLARLSTTLDVQGTGVDRPIRQRSLYDTIAWSYDLLEPRLQAFFRRLGVFAGSAELDAVRTVVGEDEDPVDRIADLVDVSLVAMVEGPGGEPRIQLLDTVREFAQQRLSAEGERSDVSRRHAEHYLSLAETVAPQLLTAQQLSAGERLETEQDNFRAALGWALQPRLVERPTPEQAKLGMRLAAALQWFWSSHGHIADSGLWLDLAVQRSDDVDDAAKATVLHGIGIRLMWHSGVRPHQDPALELIEALDIYRRLDDKSGMSDVSNTLGQWHYEVEEFDRALDFFEQSIALAREAGDNSRLAAAMAEFAWLLFDEGLTDRAMDLMRESRELSRALGDERDVLHKEKMLAQALMMTGQLEESRDQLLGIIPGVLRVRQPVLGVSVIAALALVFARLGDAERAVRLAAAREALGATFGWPSFVTNSTWQATLIDLRQQLDSDAIAQAMAVGGSYSIEDALHDALASR